MFFYEKKIEIIETLDRIIRYTASQYALGVFVTHNTLINIMMLWYDYLKDKRGVV